LRDINPGLLREGMRRWSGLAVFVGDRNRRTSNLLGHIRLRRRDARHKNRQTPWCIEIDKGAGRGQSLSLQQLSHAFPQFQGARINHARWNLFTADFKQKVRHRSIYLSSQNPMFVNVSAVTIDLAME
jgi:hypothetical protein